MKNYPVIKKIISGRELELGKYVFIKSQFEESKYTLIKGHVYHKNEPVENVAVIIICINKTTIPYEEEIIGLVFTDENGIYGLSVRLNNEFEYRIEVYS